MSNKNIYLNLLRELIEDRDNYTWFDGEWESLHCNFCGKVIAGQNWKIHEWEEYEHDSTCVIVRAQKLVGTSDTSEDDPHEEFGNFPRH